MNDVVDDAADEQERDNKEDERGAFVEKRGKAEDDQRKQREELKNRQF